MAPDMMNALVVHDDWLKDVSQLRVSRIPIPPVTDDTVQLRIEAIGANFFDILMVTGKYQFKPAFPFIPGAEFAGVVTAIGKDVTEFKVGDRVFGGSMTGAYAEYITVSPVQIYHIPDRLTFEQACGVYSTFPTSYAALTLRAQLKKGETVLVHAGAGGVGIAAVQIAKFLGASQVIATVGSQDKMEIARRLGGADHVINYTTEDWTSRVKELTDGRGVDVVYDPVGLVEESTKCIAWNGRILVIGFAGGTIPKLPVNRVLLKNCSVIGLMWGGYMTNEPEVIPGVFKDLLDLFNKGLTPVVYEPVYDGLENAVAALQALASRKTYGKVVVRPRARNISKL